MIDNKIKTLYAMRSRIVERFRDVYEVNSSPRRWRWLERFGRYILKKLGCLEREPLYMERIEYSGLQSDRLCVAMRDAITSLALTHNLRPEQLVLIMGSDKYREFCSNQPLRHDFDYQGFMGVKVVVVPWLEGWALVPSKAIKC